MGGVRGRDRDRGYGNLAWRPRALGASGALAGSAFRQFAPDPVQLCDGVRHQPSGRTNP